MLCAGVRAQPGVAVPIPRGSGKRLTFSREIFFLPQPLQVKGNLGQTSWCA